MKEVLEIGGTLQKAVMCGVCKKEETNTWILFSTYRKDESRLPICRDCLCHAIADMLTQEKTNALRTKYCKFISDLIISNAISEIKQD